MAGVDQLALGHEVSVLSKTWARDSHDLFDYEANAIQTRNFTVTRQAQFVRTANDVEMQPEIHTTPAGSDALLQVNQLDNTFWVDTALSNKKLWVVVRDLANRGHRLSQRDVIKLGRYKFRVRQMVGSGNQVVDLDDTGSSIDVDFDEIPRLQSTTCRICLLEGSSTEDPLIQPCGCKGSIQYVHLACLRHWIRGRLNLSDSDGGSYFYRSLSCELCKSPYPAYVNIPNARQSLVELPRMTAPFIVLEHMVRDSRHAQRGSHVLSLADNKLVKLGRGHESDVRIADVSISRWHASIRYHQGQFLLEDNNSKFGTLVAKKKSRLESGSPLSVQVGRTVFTLTSSPL